MRNQDEFDDLIKSFKLDDIEEPQQTYAQSVHASRQSRAQNTAPKSPAAAAYHQRPQQTPARPSRASVSAVQRPQHAAAPARVQMHSVQMEQEQLRRAQQRKQQFRVNIREDAFNEPADPSSPDKYTPARGGGRGGNGGGRDGGDGGDGGFDGNSHGSGAGRWAKAIVALVIVLGVSAFLAFFALESASDMFGLNKPDVQIEVTLPENQSMSEIADLLKSNGVIKQPLTFQLYAGLKNDAESFIPGTYLLNSNMSYDQIMIVFRTGNVNNAEVTIMFPEGSTLSEIADKLEENNVCDRQELFDYLEEAQFPYDYEFLDQVPDDPNRFRRYEGYFFPDTYDFYENENVDTVVQKFFRRFDEMVDTDEIDALLASNDMTLDEAITLASIIQKEAGLPEDMVGVSSVFHKRLDNPDLFPRLESDVTVFYVENDIKPYLQVDNQEMYDAYNTRVSAGLPVGPICSPGMDAIMAALQPEQTEYYYFLADRDGNFYYAATLDEHNANIRAAGIEGVHGIALPEE